MTEVYKNKSEQDERSTSLSMKRGFASKCPNCGEGKLFNKFVKVTNTCSTCKEAMHHHQADDLPAYLVILIIGHVVVGAFMATDMVFKMASWQHLLIWIPFTTLLTLALLQPVKGAVVGLQWALRMHGFGEQPDYDDSAYEKSDQQA
jgi:uncharacterized protein (DUF983 family)